MGQSLVQIYVHLVYSTKHRKPFLVNADHQSRLHAYLAGTFGKLDAPAIVVGGVEDHVHILCRLGKAIDIATLIKKKEELVRVGEIRFIDPRLLLANRIWSISCQSRSR